MRILRENKTNLRVWQIWFFVWEGLVLIGRARFLLGVYKHLELCV